MLGAAKLVLCLSRSQGERRLRAMRAFLGRNGAAIGPGLIATDLVGTPGDRCGVEFGWIHDCLWEVCVYINSCQFWASTICVT